MLDIHNAGVALAQKCVTPGAGGRAEGGVVSGLGVYLVKISRLKSYELDV